MATSQEFADFILDQFRLTEGVSLRKMMGEYVLYCRDKVMGGLYDGRLLVKPTPASRALMPDAVETPPYPGAKPMLEVVRLEEPAFLAQLAGEMWPELPDPTPKKRKSK